MIGGGYTWEDIYSEAASRNVIVVGGGTPVRETGLFLPTSFERHAGSNVLADCRLSWRLDARRRTQSRNS